MLIIDRHRDVYDYMVDVYGIDTKYVFNREKLNTNMSNLNFIVQDDFARNIKLSNSVNIKNDYFHIAIANDNPRVIRYSINHRILKYLVICDLMYVYYDGNFVRSLKGISSDKREYCELVCTIDVPQDITRWMVENQIPIFEMYYDIERISDIKNGSRLIRSLQPKPIYIKDVPICKHIDPISTYTKVSNFLYMLADPKVIEVDNASKIVQAGFDLKSSFRIVK